MSKYKIKRWDPVLFGNDVNPLPMIYIKPDQSFLDFAKENKYNVIVRIEDTKTEYDGHAMVGVINKSSNVPNDNRCIFYEKTGLYVIVLYGPWLEYPDPDNLGSAVIMGLKGKNPLKLPKNEPCPTVKPMEVCPTTREPYKSDLSHDNCSLNTIQLWAIIISIIIVFGALLWLTMSTTNKNNIIKV